jgi:hypothetical protein
MLLFVDNYWKRFCTDSVKSGLLLANAAKVPSTNLHDFPDRERFANPPRPPIYISSQMRRKSVSFIKATRRVITQTVDFLLIEVVPLVSSFSVSLVHCLLYLVSRLSYFSLRVSLLERKKDYLFSQHST